MRQVPRPSVDERRREILEATCKVVIERGFANTRIADVANELGVSSGLIHYHFESKGALFAEALRYASESDLARLASTVAEGDTAIQKLERIFQLYSPSESEPEWLLWIDSWGEAMRSRELRDISQELDLAWKHTIEQIILEGVESGEFQCDDPNGAGVEAHRCCSTASACSSPSTRAWSTRGEMIDWVREAAAKELGLASPATTGAALRRVR